MKITTDNAPELIKESELKILAAKNTITALKEKMANICRVVSSKVAAETTDGKKTYSNAAERELATEQRLSEDSHYQALKTALADAENQKSEEEINLQYIRDEFSSLRYKMRLTCATRSENASDKFLTGMQILAGLEPLIKVLYSEKKASNSNTDAFVPDDCPF